MRQAGRMFPEYRQLRDSNDFMDICRDPALTSRVTRMPVEKLGVDAAIIFADIMHPLYCLDTSFELVSGTGPVIDDPVRNQEDVDALQAKPPAEAVGFLADGLRQTRQDLPGEVPLIGFTGAPFTMACYLVQGSPSRNFPQAKRLMFSEPETWKNLMSHLTEVLTDYSRLQVEAGADVIQLFDSWVGGLSGHHYKRHVLPHVHELVTNIQNLDVPVISFATGNPELLPYLDEAQPDVIGVDWRIDLETAHQRIPRSCPLQGNLDPSLLLASWSELRPEVDQLLEAGSAPPTHIVNLGHGVLPDTDPETVQNLVNYIQEHG